MKEERKTNGEEKAEGRNKGRGWQIIRRENRRIMRRKEKKMKEKIVEKAGERKKKSINK